MRKQKVFIRIGAAFVAFVIVLGNGAVIASSGSENAARKGVAYLKKQIHEDGGYGSKDGASTVIETSQVIIAFEAAGEDPLPKSKAGKSPIDYLKINAKPLADSNTAIENTARIAQMIVALKAAGQDPSAFAGIDWLEVLSKARENATGWYGNYAINHIWAMLAIESCGKKVDDVSIEWLIDNQEDNGGYALDKKGGMGADSNTTALAIQALLGAGEKKTSQPVKKAIEFLKTQQNKDGGFPFVTPSQYGTESDCGSTAWVIQALIAANEDIEGKTWVKAAVTPMGFLMSLQNADGAFMYQKVVPEDSVYSTTQAIPALMTKPFPFKAPAAKTTQPAAEPEAAKSQLGLYLGLAAIVVFAAVLGFFIVNKRA